jgi:hypothetical protein
MKKFFIILSIIVLIVLLALGLFYFLGGKKQVSDFFSDTDFGSFFDVDPQSDNDTIDSPIGESPVQKDTTYVAPLLRQISFEPVSGFTFYSTTSTTTVVSLDEAGMEVKKEELATTTVVRFQERATGHIYDVFEFIEAPQKVSAITERKIYSTIWSNNKDQFLFQKLAPDNEQIQTSFSKIVFSTSTEAQLQNTPISSSISDFIFNRKANKIIYSVKQGGYSAVFASSPDRTLEKPVVTLPFVEFILDSINANEVLLTTKASYSAPGYAYILNLTSGTMTKLIGNIPGLLVKISPDKKYYIYTESGQSRPVVRYVNSTTGVTKNLLINTIPEKCIFPNKINTNAYCFGSLLYSAGKYPDDWYKGKVTNSDTLYNIEFETELVDITYNFNGDNLDFDVINPQITDDDKFIIFQNKKDLTLWSLNVGKLAQQF